MAKGKAYASWNKVNFWNLWETKQEAIKGRKTGSYAGM